LLLAEEGLFMPRLKSAVGPFSVLLILGAIVLAITPRSSAQQESVLYNFNPAIRDGVGPQGNLIFDAAGNLYGTTYIGGVHSCGGAAFYCGTAFELSRARDGSWTEKVIHNFGSGTDGYGPSAGMIFDAAGNLYGTTYQGGAYGYGTVFELSPTVDGGWAERVLHHFNYDGKDGINPVASLMLDSSGNLYGTTLGGGTSDGGTVFELIRTADGNFTEKILHSFTFNGADGVNPYGALVLDNSGDVFSTTSGGGLYGWGTVFELSASAGGKWTEKILHNFNYNGKDGVQPTSGLAFDASGNLYGSAAGGVYNWGTVYELSPGQNGNWTESILHNFNLKAADGTNPAGAVSIDDSGNLYGTTLSGGLYTYGTIYELSPATGGDYSEKILHNFSGTLKSGALDGTDGREPESALTLDGTGNLYGTTYQGGAFGGAFGYGTVFEITP
jgi:uncharacterized repeat protein (TIGR03803 family)